MSDENNIDEKKQRHIALEKEHRYRATTLKKEKRFNEAAQELLIAREHAYASECWPDADTLIRAPTYWGMGGMHHEAAIEAIKIARGDYKYLGCENGWHKTTDRLVCNAFENAGCAFCNMKKRVLAAGFFAAAAIASKQMELHEYTRYDEIEQKGNFPKINEIMGVFDFLNKEGKEYIRNLLLKSWPRLTTIDPFDIVKKVADELPAVQMEEKIETYPIENADYIAMLTRTNISTSKMDKELLEIIKMGGDLAQITKLEFGACVKCKKWEGKIISITGRDTRFPTLEQAKTGGIFHPNCQHTALYIDLDIEADEIERQAKANQKKQFWQSSQQPLLPEEIITCPACEKQMNVTGVSGYCNCPHCGQKLFMER